MIRCSHRQAGRQERRGFNRGKLLFRTSRPVCVCVCVLTSLGVDASGRA